MKIVACVRQTPDTETIVKIADNKTSIKTDDIKYIIGPYDEYSLEAAVQIKDETKGDVTVLSMGPNRVPETLRACLASLLCFRFAFLLMVGLERRLTK